MSDINNKNTKAWWQAYLIPAMIALVIGFLVTSGINSIATSLAKLDMNSNNLSNFISLVTTPAKVLEIADGDQNAYFAVLTVGIMSVITMVAIVLPLISSRFVGKFGLKSAAAIAVGFSIPLLIGSDIKLALLPIVFIAVFLAILWFATEKIDSAFLSIGTVCAGFGAAFMAAFGLAALLHNFDPFELVFYAIPEALGPGFSMLSRINDAIPYVTSQSAVGLISNSMIVILFTYICYMGAAVFGLTQRRASESGRLKFVAVKFSDWSLPNSFIIATFVLGFGATMLASSTNQMFATVSNVAFTIFTSAFTVQAISLIVFMTKKLRSPLPILAGLVLVFVPILSSLGLPLLGVMDQVMKIRQRMQNAEAGARKKYNEITASEDENPINQEGLEELLRKMSMTANPDTKDEQAKKESEDENNIKKDLDIKDLDIKDEKIDGDK